MTRTTTTFVARAAVLIAASTADARISEYFMYSGDQARFTVVQNGQIVRQWPIAQGTAQYPYPIAVRDTVRTMGADEGGQGAEYDFVGNDLNQRYSHEPGPTRCWDGTTDGEFNYTIDTGGRVWRCNLNWTDPVNIFSAGGLGAITCDLENDSLWVSQFSSSTVRQFDRSGNVISSFDAGHTQVMALALDYADGTLWIHNRNTQGTIEQWSRDGQLLATIAVPGLEGQNALTGEFALDVQAPPTLEINGVCPGHLTAVVTGATRRGRVAFVYGTHDGLFANPGNPCAGIVIDIRPPFLPGAPRMVNADANGNALLSADVPNSLCGRGRVQVVDLSTCTVSNLAVF